MGLGEIMERFRKVKARIGDSEELTPEVDDKQLVSLQRQRQIQLNKMEKERLRKVIKSHAKGEFRKNMGLGKAKEKVLYGRTSRRSSILNEGNPLMKEKRKKVRGIL